MSQACTCHVCLNANGATATCLGDDPVRVQCTVCGDYVVTLEAIEDDLGADWGDKKWPAIKRAALSHALRQRLNVPLHEATKLPLLTRAVLNDLEKNISLPTPLEQARNIIRFIGDHNRETGDVLESFPDHFCAVVGAPTLEAAVQLLGDLRRRGDIEAIERKITGLGAIVHTRLTLAGWKEWEEIHKGRRAARDGFIAMQFNDARLDDFVAKVVQPCVLEALGVKANRLDSSEIVTAGVIDNIMREAIQNAAFVLVDLSHGNRGAYWEAGYAEGLGKPVIYLCEKAAFESLKPHFDVNHCTIVMWEEDKPEPFKLLLAATLRNAMRKAGRDV